MGVLTKKTILHHSIVDHLSGGIWVRIQTQVFEDDNALGSPSMAEVHLPPGSSLDKLNDMGLDPAAGEVEVVATMGAAVWTPTVVEAYQAALAAAITPPVAEPVASPAPTPTTAG